MALAGTQRFHHSGSVMSGVDAAPIAKTPIQMMSSMPMYANETTAHSVPTSADGMHPAALWKMHSAYLGLDAGANEVYDHFGNWNEGALINRTSGHPPNVARIAKFGFRIEFV